MMARFFKHTWYVAIVAVLAAMIFAGCGSSTSSSGAAQTTTITLYSSGDVNVQSLWRDKLIPAFEHANPNIKVNLVFSVHGTTDSVTLSRLSAAVAANKSAGLDVIDAGFVTQAATAKLLAPLTTQEIPYMSRIDPQLLQAVQSSAIPYRASSVVLAYNSQYVQNPPATLSDLLTWIKAHPGKFTYNSPSTGGSGQAFVQAVLNTSIPSSDLTTFKTGYDATLEKDWQPGLQQLKALNPYVYQKGQYPNGNAAVLQLLASGSIWLAPVWSDMSLTYLSQNLLPSSVKLIQLNPPFNGGPAYMGIPQTAQHKQQAYTFLNWVLGPDQQSTIIQAMHGYPGVQWSYVPQSVQQQYASIAHAYGTFYTSKFNADMNKTWQSQVAGG